MKRLLVVFTAAWLLSGCAVLSQLLAAAFQQPAFRFKNVALHGASFEGIHLDTVWQLDNPNAVALSLASVEYALFVDDKQVVAGAPPTGLRIPAQGSTELVFPANVKFLEIVPALEALFTKDSATWRVQGTIGVDTPLGLIKLPLAAEDDFDTPKIPAVQFQDPKVTNISLQGATVEFPMTVTNRSTFPLDVGTIVGTVSVAGTPVGTLSTGSLGALDAKGARQVKLPLTINFFSAGTAAVNAIRGGNANVKFDAQLKSGNAQLPIKLDQVLNFTKL